jgi:hypothetical protein
VEVLNRPDNLKRVAEFKAAAEKQARTRVEADAGAEKLFVAVNSTMFWTTTSLG